MIGKSMEPLLQKLLLVLTPCLFAANLGQSLFYLPEAGTREKAEHMPHSLYYICFTAFFGAMVFALLAPSLPLLWVAVELTTLVSAPLIAFHRTKDSLEAMWKYLLICSIGIALALFGTMLVMHAKTTGNVQWYKAGFAFILAGYGTKTGLAPFHTWLPDAHSEAPAPVSALLSGALLNCSLYAIVRFREAMPPEASPFCDAAMLSLGLLSVAVAAVFMVRQSDYKRLLAYSSVEHMGLAAIMLSLFYSNPGQPKTLLCAVLGHIAAHSITKTMLFQTAGNLLLAFGTRAIAAVQGIAVPMKGHATLWMAGLLFICGAPPSLLFFTELGLVAASPLWLSLAVLSLLFIVFAAMMKAALTMVAGKPLNAPSPIPGKMAFIPFLLLAVLVLAGAIAAFFIIRAA